MTLYRQNSFAKGQVSKNVQGRIDQEAIRTGLDTARNMLLALTGAIENRAGTTFRKLPDAAKQDLSEAKAIKLMLAEPSMIKRPVLDTGRKRLVGFKPDSYAEVLGAGR